MVLTIAVLNARKTYFVFGEDKRRSDVFHFRLEHPCSRTAPMTTASLARPSIYNVVAADCNRVYVAEKASLSSPLTPVHYHGQPVECSWTIDGGIYTHLHLTTGSSSTLYRHKLMSILISSHVTSLI